MILCNNTNVEFISKDTGRLGKEKSLSAMLFFKWNYFLNVEKSLLYIKYSAQLSLSLSYTRYFFHFLKLNIYNAWETIRNIIQINVKSLVAYIICFIYILFCVIVFYYFVHYLFHYLFHSSIILFINYISHYVTTNKIFVHPR